MKVLVIGPLPDPINGCSYANEVLLKNLESRNINYAYINTNTKKISSKQGQRFSSAKALYFLRKYLEIYKIFNSSVVYVTPGQTFFGVVKYAPFFLLCKLLHKPYVIHLHGNYLGTEYKGLKGLRKKIFCFLITGASAGIVLSQSLIANFEHLLPAHKIYVVENFVDEFLFLLPSNKNRKHLRILYLSNLMREKGILDFLDALILLKQKNIFFHATVAGNMEAGLEKEFNDRHELLGKQLEYLGTVSGEKKREILSDSNVFVLPTYYKMEGQPVCLLEGMATGNIIITTKHAGIPDVISKSNGFFINEKSSVEIMACLEKIHLDLSMMVSQFSEHNIKYTAEKFTEKIFTEKIVSILQRTSKPAVRRTSLSSW